MGELREIRARDVLDVSVSESAKIRSFTHFSKQLIYAAISFALRSHELEQSGGGSDEIRSQVIGAVILSVAFLEATVNELFLRAADGQTSFSEMNQDQRQAIGREWCDETEGLSILEKFDRVLAVCGALSFEKGEGPYQRAALLIRFRNSMLHYKEGWLEDGKTSKIQERLGPSFRPQKEKTRSLLDALSYESARWSIETARAFVDEFFQRLNLDPFCRAADLPGGGVLPSGTGCK